MNTIKYKLVPVVKFAAFKWGIKVYFATVAQLVERRTRNA